MPDLVALVQQLAVKLGDSLIIGLMMGGGMSLAATLLVIRCRLTRDFRQALRIGLVAGAVVGLVFVGISLFT